MLAGPIATLIIAQTMAAHPESLKVSLENYACMVEAIHFEAEGESREGKIAVANVVLNRVNSSRFPGDVCGVVKQPKQFSYRNGGEPIVKISDAIEKRSFAESAEIALLAVNGDLSDPTNGADHYFNPDKVNPKWANASKYEIAIDNHLFVKL